MYERGYYPAYDLKQLLKMMFKMCKGNTNAILKWRFGNYHERKTIVYLQRIK